MSLPEQGQVLGIDVGWASTRETTGFCALSWDAHVVRWSCAKTGKSWEARAQALRQLLGDRRQVLAVAVDGPLRPGLQFDSSTCRAAEKLLSRGRFQRRGKPGPTNGGSGPQLHCEATALAQLALEQLSVVRADHELRVHECAVVEAFPNLFLGVLCDETDYPQKPAKKRKWTDSLYPLVKPKLEGLLRLLLPSRQQGASLDIADHEEIAAFTCALTALCVTARRFAGVGSRMDGLIILPPSHLWGKEKKDTGPWAEAVLRGNLDSVAREFPGATIYEGWEGMAIGAERRGTRESPMHPLTVNLPFNRESLQGRFVFGKNLDSPEDRVGYWLLVQAQSLFVCEDGTETGWRVPRGPLPAVFDGYVEALVRLGTYLGDPCWAGAVAADLEAPPGFQLESILPIQTRLTDDVLSLGGLAHQAIHWETTSRHCPRCGEQAIRIDGEWGKKCSLCAYEHYPHLHPAVIVLVRDGDRVLLTRKSFWPKGRYGLIAGFVDVGESLEGAASREVREEAGLEIRDLQYAGSQYWPFPSQLMIGFTATYAGGDLRVNREELEDATWFPVSALPDLPPKLSIARFLLDHHARR